MGEGDATDERTYQYRWDGEREVAWSLTSATSLRALTGSIQLTPVDQRRTVATQQLSLVTTMPLIGPLRRRAELILINRALPVWIAADRRTHQDDTIPTYVQTACIGRSGCLSGNNHDASFRQVCRDP